LTICISVICDVKEKPKVIVASDRMITAGHLAIQFEHGVPKIEELSSTCVALTSGSITYTEIFDRSRVKIAELKEPTVHEIAHIVKDEYIEEKKRRAEDSILKHRGLSFGDIYSGRIPIELLVRLDGEIDEMRIELEVLVCGVDSSGGHIYYIRDAPVGMRMGMIDCFDSLGYMAIGSGSPHAVTTFITCSCTPYLPLRHALFIVYDAKKAAEVAPGVGKDTDIRIIDEKGTHEIAKSTIETLETIYNRKREIMVAPKSELDKLIEGLKIEYKN
jgi:20S proteasome alpha/beta subunit